MLEWAGAQIFRGLVLCSLLACVPKSRAEAATPADTRSSDSSPSSTNDESPMVLTAAICAPNTNTEHPLFRFKRTATRAGSTLNVLREYSYPDGQIAARERVVYKDHNLVSYELDELQTGGSGSATIVHDPNHHNKSTIVFRYAKDASARAVETRSEPLLPNTLVNDTVGFFLEEHWGQLMRAEKVSCRYLVVPRKETIGFVFKKESEMQWHGHSAVVLRMEPASLLIAALVEPLHFIVEKAAPHRVLEYTGRTTPKIGKPGDWREFDAVTIFNWEPNPRN